MIREIPESDWKVFKQVHPLALERFCSRANEELASMAQDTGRPQVERFHALCDRARQLSRDCHEVFADFRRSTARVQLLAMRGHGVLKPEEIARFTPETQAVINWTSE